MNHFCYDGLKDVFKNRQLKRQLIINRWPMLLRTVKEGSISKLRCLLMLNNGIIAQNEMRCDGLKKNWNKKSYFFIYRYLVPLIQSR